MMTKIGTNVMIYTKGWFVVRSYQEFCEALEVIGDKITDVSFDYDLLMTDGKAKTGADCAAYMAGFFKHKTLPNIHIHSTNETGRIEILKNIA